MREQCSFCRNKSEADRDLYRFAFERGHSQSAFTLRQACPERSRRGEGLRANGEDKQAEPKLFVLIVGSCCTQYSPCPLAVQPERNEAKSKAALPIDASTSPLTRLRSARTDWGRCLYCMQRKLAMSPVEARTG